MAQNQLSITLIYCVFVYLSAFRHFLLQMELFIQ